MKYRLFLFKRQVEDVFIFPFVLIGKIISKLVFKTEPFDILFIFPFYHTGGAEKVHSLIANTFKGKKGMILFTRKSVDNRYFEKFKASGHQIIDISRYTDNKLFYWNNLVFRGIVAGLVNQQSSKLLVFNGQSNFGYKLSPWINHSINQIELIHAFSSFSWIRIPFIPYYNSTVMISRHAIEEHRLQYQQLGIPDFEFNKIHYITNGIAIPSNLDKPTHQGNYLKVLYVGRATEEKRVNLIASIAKEAAVNNLPIQFNMVGNIKNEIDPSYHSYIHFYGAVNNEETLYQIYKEHQVLLMTSSREGFPISIMEAMASGCTILSTPVGDIPYHVKHNQNGYLFSSVTDEEGIRTEAIHFLTSLLKDPEQINVIIKKNQEYAHSEFDLPIFEKRYITLFEKNLNA
jgi:glycosyltransferase involved in cell wall biosynthesis